MINLIVEPNTVPMSWQKFCESKPAFSVALDGYVENGPRFLPANLPGGPKANYNHHAEVDRMATRATCSQVLMAVRMGLFETFRTKNGPELNVFANDCDQDVCTAYYVLKNGWYAEKAMNSRLNKLVGVEELLDTTCGAYPFPKDLPLLQELNWVFEDYNEFKLSGRLDNRIAEEYVRVINSVADRINAFVHQHADRKPLDTSYAVKGGGDGWKLVEEFGSQAKTGMFSDGIQAFVSYRPMPKGKFWYSVGRMSHFVPFDVPGVLHHLNSVIGKNSVAFGGGDTVGGCRVGCFLTPTVVEREVNKFLRSRFKVRRATACVH